MPKLRPRLRQRTLATAVSSDPLACWTSSRQRPSSSSRGARGSAGGSRRSSFGLCVTPSRPPGPAPRPKKKRWPPPRSPKKISLASAVAVSTGALAFGGHIGNMPQLDGAAAGRGAMNAGPDDQVVRIVPLVQMVQGTPVPSLGLETLRVAADSGIAVERTPGGLLALKLDTVRVRLQDDGRTWLRTGANASVIWRANATARWRRSRAP